jgi:hypothetical protein
MVRLIKNGHCYGFVCWLVSLCILSSSYWRLTYYWFLKEFSIASTVDEVPGDHDNIR